MLTGLGAMHAKRLDAALLAHGVTSAAERSVDWLAGADEATLVAVWKTWRTALVGAQKSPTLPNFKAMCAALRRYLHGSPANGDGGEPDGTCAEGSSADEGAGVEGAESADADDDGADVDDDGAEGDGADDDGADDDGTDDNGNDNDGYGDEFHCAFGSGCEPESWADELPLDEYGVEYFPEEVEDGEDDYEDEGDDDLERPPQTLSAVANPSERLHALQADLAA